MIGVESKLYEIITWIMEIIFLSVICFIIAIPIFTLPVAILFYCKTAGNIVSERKFFDFSGISKNKVLQMCIYFLIGICSIYSSLMLTQMNDFMISRLIISLIICFNTTMAILILEKKNTFFKHARNAFFYSVANFHKTILPVFLYIEIRSKLNGMLPAYAVIGITCFSCYFLFQINYKAIEKLVPKESKT